MKTCISILILFILNLAIFSCNQKDSDPSPTPTMATITGASRLFISPPTFYRTIYDAYKIEHHFFPMLYGKGTINIRALGTSYSTTTDTLGKFNLIVPSNATYNIVAEKEGYGSVTIMGINPQDSLQRLIYFEMYKKSKFRIDSLSVYYASNSKLIFKFKVFDTDSGIYKKITSSPYIGSDPSILFVFSESSSIDGKNFEYLCQGNFLVYNFNKYTGTTDSSNYLIAEITNIADKNNPYIDVKLPLNKVIYAVAYGNNYSNYGQMLSYDKGYYRNMAVYNNLGDPSNRVQFTLN